MGVQVQNLLMQVCDETSNIAEVQLKVQLPLGYRIGDILLDGLSAIGGFFMFRAFGVS